MYIYKICCIGGVSELIYWQVTHEGNFVIRVDKTGKEEQFIITDNFLYKYIYIYTHSGLIQSKIIMDGCAYLSQWKRVAEIFG